MDVEIPDINIDYDYAVDLLISGEFKHHVKGNLLYSRQSK